jgi:hypothetical protein
MIVTFRITVAPEVGARYELGNGSAFGSDVAPAPGAVLVVSVEAGAGVATGAGAATVDRGRADELQPPATATRRARCDARIWERISCMGGRYDVAPSYATDSSRAS